MATIKDVARMAGVSISTVSKYLNGGNVRPENLEPIRKAVATLDYQANPYARGLKSRRSHSIGILLPSLSAPFYGTVIMSMDKVLRDAGYHSIISCYGANHGLERDYLKFLISTGIDGLVYIPEDLSADEFYELTAKCSIPVVQVDRMIQGVQTDVVLSDNSDSVYQGVSKLIEQGSRRVAIITGPKAVFTAKERLVGYLRALSDHDIPYDDALVRSGELEFATGYQGFLSLMSDPNPPTAICCTNYEITIGIITAAQERGVRIPQDIQVMGYDCVEVCSMMSPPLPVVQQPETQIGQMAGRYMIERLEGCDLPPRLSRLNCKIHF